MAVLLTNRPWDEIANTILLPNEIVEDKQSKCPDSGVCLVSLLRCQGPADVLVVLSESDKSQLENESDLEGLGELLGLSAENALSLLRSGVSAHSALLQAVHVADTILGIYIFFLRDEHKMMFS